MNTYTISFNQKPGTETLYDNLFFCPMADSIQDAINQFCEFEWHDGTHYTESDIYQINVIK